MHIFRKKVCILQCRFASRFVVFCGGVFVGFLPAKENFLKCCIQSLWYSSRQKWWMQAWAQWIAKYISPQWTLWYLGFQWSVKCSAHFKSCFQAIHVRWHNRQWLGFAKRVFNKFSFPPVWYFGILYFYLFKILKTFFSCLPIFPTEE